LADIIEHIGTATVQHGKVSDRVYLMKAGDEEPATLLERIEQLARERVYTKIFAKTPGSFAPHFERAGYAAEARIPEFYDGREEAVFWGKYFGAARRKEDRRDEHEEVLHAALARQGQAKEVALPEGLHWRRGLEDDADQIAGVYRTVFESYPFPIHDPAYIRQTMHENFVYFAVFEGDKVVAVSSSEMDEKSANVEMTDFATLPAWRGKSLAVFLLQQMEKAMTSRGIRTAYTIARAVSHGMNITFARLGYEYGGRLINNTNICGRMESMNIWYKPLGR
jgi:putative beta-lysine N-acetyltransferase